MLVTATIKADEFHNNTATILIGRNDAYDYNEEVIPDEKVATGGRKFEKYDASSKQMLSGAQFEIWNSNKEQFAVFTKEQQHQKPMQRMQTGSFGKTLDQKLLQRNSLLMTKEI